MNMKKMFVQGMRSVGGIVVGYAVFVAGTWIAQGVILGGVSYRNSSLAILIMAGILTPAAGVIGGLVTSAIAGVRPFLHILPMCLLIVLETSYLYSRGLVDGPLWFEAAAGGSLVVGAIIGVRCWLLWVDRHATRAINALA
jgi:hypothetical protein